MEQTQKKDSNKKTVEKSASPSKESSDKKGVKSEKPSLGEDKSKPKEKEAVKEGEKIVKDSKIAKPATAPAPDKQPSDPQAAAAGNLPQAAAPGGPPAPASLGEGNMVQMGNGLPDLPPRPAAPIRQAIPSTAVTLSSNGFPQRVPNLKQASKPQFNIPPGSDLGMVGKIGVYQMSHKSSAADIHANIFFWVYLITFITTFYLIKRK